MFLSASTLFPTLTLLSAVITLLVAAFAYRKENLQVDWSFSLLMVACSIYSLNYSLELFSEELVFKTFYLKLQYFGAPFISPLMLIFTIQYSDQRQYLNKWSTFAVFIVPILNMLAVLSNDWHHLFYTSYNIIQQNGLSILITEKGPLYVFHNAYSLLLASLTVYLFIRLFITTNRLYLTQISFVFLGFIIPYLTYVLYFIDVVPIGIDPIPISFAGTGIFIYVGFQQYNLFKIAPIAYQTLFENLSDGILWFDDKKKSILALNDSAKEMLGIPQLHQQKQLTESIIKQWPEFENVLEKLQHETSFEFTRDTDSGKKWFSVAPSTIAKKSKEVLGYFILIKDITKTKESDFQYREAQILLNTFFDQVPMLMGVVMLQEKDIILLKGNQLTAKYLTGAFGEVSNLSFKSVGFSTEEIQHWIYEFRLAEIKQKNSYLEMNLSPKRTTREFTLGVTFVYLGIMPGGQKRYAFIAQDITEKKKAEAEIVKSNVFLNQTSKVAQVGGWEINLEKNTADLTLTTREIFELEPHSNPSPSRLLNYFTDESKVTVLPKAKALLKNGEPFDLELTIYNSTRQKVWIRLIANAEFEQNKCVRLYGIVQNIDLIKRNSIELKAAEEKLDSIFREMSDVVWSVSLPEQQVVFITPSVKDLYGIAVEQWYQSKHCRERAVFEDDIEIVQKIWQELEKHGSYTAQFRISTPRVGIKWIQFKAKVIYSVDGVPIRIDGYESDITNQKFTQEQLEFARNEAIRANNAKSEFLANMSHEIRTPLNGIIGFNDLLQKTELNEDQLRFVSNTKSSAESLLTIINDILDFSKVESGKFELEWVESNVIKIIEQSIEMFIHQAEQKHIELILSIQPDLPEFAVVDSLRVKQILINLIGNALKFTRKGEVELKVNFEAITQNKGVFTFKVRDTGIGISKLEKEKLFKAFSQADTSTTRKFGGTGLGLAISNNLANMMNSSIKLHSESGVGSEFSFELETTFRSGNTEKLSSIYKPENVLVLDDNQSFLDSFKQNFDYCGIQTDFTSSETEAEHLLQLKQYDCVFIDYSLIDAERAKWLKHLQSQKSKRKPDVIFLLSHKQLAEIHQINEDFPVVNYLCKPLKHDDLRALLKGLSSLDEIPVESKESLESEPKAECIRTKRPVHILIAEDVEVNRILIQSIISNSFDQVVLYLAENGKQAIETFNVNTIDIVLMDIQMPEMDGLEATRKIREIESSKSVKTPIFALTAGALQEEKHKAFMAGVNEFITKPIDYDVLYHTCFRYTKELDLLLDEALDTTKHIFNKKEFEKRMSGVDEIKKLTLVNAKRDIPIYIDSLLDALSEKNFAEIKRIAHSIKGLALTMGFEELGDLSKQIELEAKNQNQLSNWTLLLKRSWESIETELDSYSA
ncbi:response regulator [bacterium]|nr:MAG: response regulator [bacterium]